jgi:hypothetical protein
MHSIALVPFDGCDFNIAKSNNRLALSLFHGVAVVADGIDSYREFSDCVILDDWSGIARYLADYDLLRRHVTVGHARAASNYCAEIIGKQWLSLLLRVASDADCGQ